MNFRQSLFLLLFLILLACAYALRTGPRGMANHVKREINFTSHESALANSHGSHVESIEIQQANPQQTFSLERKGGDWFVKIPMEYPAVSDLMNQWIMYAATQGQQKSFLIKSDKELVDLGFSPYEAKWCATLGRLSTPHCLLLGKEAPFTGGVYAKWSDEMKAFVVSPDFASSIKGASLYQLRRKQLFPFAFRDGEAVKVSSLGSELVIEKKDREWWMTKPEPVKLNIDLANPVLMKLNELTVREYGDNADSSAPEFGLKSSQVIQIEVSYANQPVRTLALGLVVPKLHAYAAQSNHLPGVLFVSEEKILQLLAMVQNLQHGELMNSLAKSAVA